MKTRRQEDKKARRLSLMEDIYKVCPYKQSRNFTKYFTLFILNVSQLAKIRKRNEKKGVGGQKKVSSHDSKEKKH